MMRGNRKFLVAGSFLVLGLSLLAVAPLAQTQPPAPADTSAKRKPARMLPAEMSGILLREGRAELERPEAILDRMELKDGDLVADVGCGNGFYTLRLARRIAPHGTVFAVDVQAGMLDQLKTRTWEAELTNIHPVLGAVDDPYLPPGKIDWILMVDVYHEFSQPEVMLAKIRESLAPQGRVALIEYRGEEDAPNVPPRIPRDHKMTVDEVMEEWIPAGFELVERLDFLPAQHYFIFKAAAAP